MPVCVINQPVGLGDILWIQPIVDHMIDRGYEVVYPVRDLYYEMISRSIRKDGLRWVPESGEYPMKECFSPSMTARPAQYGEDLYLPIHCSDRHLPSCPVMISKYFLLDIPVTNWHKSINFERDKGREDRVFEVYGIDRNVDYTLTNITYGTPPNHITRSISVQTNNPVVEMSYEKDQENGICLFDWIGVVEQAKEIHTIETALCFLVDMFAQTPYISMYGRNNEPPGRLTSLVYRNPNWTYYK